MDGSTVFTRLCMSVCTPANTCFLGPTRVLSPNGISIGSVMFGQLTAERPILYNGPPFRLGEI